MDIGRIVFPERVVGIVDPQLVQQVRLSVDVETIKTLLKRIADDPELRKLLRAAID